MHRIITDISLVSFHVFTLVILLSFGSVLLYQMITGETPYSKTSTKEDLFNSIKNKPLKRIADVYPFADNRLQFIIDKATKKYPHNRYKDCNEFLDALEEIN